MHSYTVATAFLQYLAEFSHKGLSFNIVLGSEKKTYQICEVFKLVCFALYTEIKFSCCYWASNQCGDMFWLDVTAFM